MAETRIPTRDLIVMAGSVLVGGVVAGAVAALIARQPVKPFSDCETKCLQDFPDDTEKRLNCMLKCVADGNLAVQRVLAVQ
ncbi:MAG: hypothetical protein ACRDGV_09620 [Candidatus Limnocylindria bacterium]